MSHSRPVVWVVGDAMLDVTVRAAHYRRTPEDPTVPVLPADAVPEATALGGAANLAANLAALGCDTTLFAPLSAQLGLAARIDAAGFAANPDIPPQLVRVTTKTRYYEGTRLVARVDADVQSDAVTPDWAVADSFYAPDAVVLTDYGRGAVTRDSAAAWSAWCRKNKVPLFADPKDGRQSLWTGVRVDYMVANWVEAAGVLWSGDEANAPRADSDPAALALAKRLATRDDWVWAGVVVVKRGARGSVWAAPDGPIGGQSGLVPVVAPRAVYDVQGAGDTYLAGLVTGTTRGLKLADACLYASAAAGVAVGRPGTAVVDRDDVVGALEPSLGRPRGVLTAVDAYDLAARLRGFGFRIGMAAGCFDLHLHPGHLAVLKSAAMGCDFLFAPVDSDARVRGLKGPGRPIIPADDRATGVASVRGVGAAFVFDTDAANVVRTLRPDVLVKGGDYSVATLPEAEYLKEWDGRVVIVPAVDTLRTSERVERLTGIPGGRGREVRA